MSQSTENDVLVTDCHEWAIQCYDRDGGLFTGRSFATRRGAEESGDRLTKINGAEWWLITRRREVTVETSPWSRVIPPVERGAPPDGGCPCCGNWPDECAGPPCVIPPVMSDQ